MGFVKLQLQKFFFKDWTPEYLLNGREMNFLNLLTYSQSVEKLSN